MEESKASERKRKDREEPVGAPDEEESAEGEAETIPAAWTVFPVTVNDPPGATPSKKGKSDESATLKTRTEYYWTLRSPDTLPDESDECEGARYVPFSPPPDVNGARDSVFMSVSAYDSYRRLGDNPSEIPWTKPIQVPVVTYAGKPTQLYMEPPLPGAFDSAGSKKDTSQGRVDYWDSAFEQGQLLAGQILSGAANPPTSFKAFKGLDWEERKKKASGKFGSWPSSGRDEREWNSRRDGIYFRLLKPKGSNCPRDERYIKLKGSGSSAQTPGELLLSLDTSAAKRNVEAKRIYIPQSTMDLLTSGDYIKNLDSYYGRLYFRDANGHRQYISIVNAPKEPATWESFRKSGVNSSGGGFGRSRDVQGLKLVFVPSGGSTGITESELQDIVDKIFKRRKIPAEDTTTATVKSLTNFKAWEEYPNHVFVSIETIACGITSTNPTVLIAEHLAARRLSNIHPPVGIKVVHGMLSKLRASD